MSDTPTQSTTYCSDLVRRQDEDRWLASSYAPAPLARALTALCAFQIELKRIPAAVSEPALGEIRLQWWREAFEEIRDGKRPRAHPVVEEIAACGIARRDFAALIDAAIDAAAQPLYGEPFADIDALEAWLVNADGSFEAIAVCLVDGDSALMSAAQRAGAAFALAREGAGLAPFLAQASAFRALALYDAAAPALRAAPPETAPAFLHLALTPLYARRAGRAFPVAKRLKLFSAMAFARY
jgi:phytoene synthase